jgi:uncharacterized protein YegL
MIQEVVAIIDRSGSMAGKEADTIGGINSTIQELKSNKVNEIIKFSVKFFDDREYVKIRSLDIENVRQLNVRDLEPRGQTALLDAMGTTISFFINKKICDPSSYDSCIIYVATDGCENCSKKFTNQNIKNLINEAKKYSIQLLYLGANQDAILEASKFGLDTEQAMNYSENRENVESAYRSAAAAAKRFRSGESIGFLQSERNASLRN